MELLSDTPPSLITAAHAAAAAAGAAADADGETGVEMVDGSLSCCHELCSSAEQLTKRRHHINTTHNVVSSQNFCKCLLQS